MDRFMACFAGVMPPSGRLGLALRPLQPAESQMAGVATGLVVEAVAGASAGAGIRVGDLLLAIDGRPVSNPARVDEQVGPADKAAALLMQREGEKRYLAVRLD